MELREKTLGGIIVNKRLLTLVLLLLLTGCKAQDGNEIYTGSVEADEVDLSAEVSGVIEKIHVRDGEKIEIGDKVMQLNTEDYELQLDLLENAKAIAFLGYRDLEDGNSHNQIKSARANVKNIEALIAGSETELRYLEKDYSDTKYLVESGAESQNKLDQMKRLVDKEKTKLQSLNRQKESFLAQLDLVLEGATAEAVESAYLLVTQKELEIENLNRTIDKSTLISPVSGYVQNVNYNIGEWITPGIKATTIIDTSELWLKIFVPEKYLHEVSLDQKVIFLDEFLQGKDVTGCVAYISSKAEFTPKNIESKENKQEMVFEVRILVSDPTATIRPGMFLDIELVGE